MVATSRSELVHPVGVPYVSNGSQDKGSARIGQGWVVPDLVAMGQGRVTVDQMSRFILNSQLLIS